MDRAIELRKKKKTRGAAVGRRIRQGVFGFVLLLVFGIVGGIENGTILLGMGVWLLVLCLAALALLVRAE